MTELLRNGTTTAAVFATVHPQSVDAFFEAARARGARMICGKCMMDRHCPDYLRDTAIQAGLDTQFLFIDEIGWNGRAFTDLEEQQIEALFKLYPWEWLMREEFAANIRPGEISVTL